MGTNYDSPDNLQFNAGDIIFISFIFVEIFKFYGRTSNFTILGKIIFFTLRLRISSPVKMNLLALNRKENAILVQMALLEERIGLD